MRLTEATKQRLRIVRIFAAGNPAYGCPTFPRKVCTDLRCTHDGWDQWPDVRCVKCGGKLREVER